MRVDVLLGESMPTPSEVAGRVVVVVDVLRASTVMIQALSLGARAVVPFREVEDVVTAAQRYNRAEVCLAGERRALPIPGFDVGNSPEQLTESTVSGRSVLMTTTNGTAALLATHGARRVFVGAWVNLSVTVAMLKAALAEGHDLLALCAGQDGRFALEDAACAGLLLHEALRGRRGVTLGDAAATARQLGRRYAADPSRLGRDASHARRLTDAGFGGDVSFCLTRDRTPLVATFADRQVTREHVFAAS